MADNKQAKMGHAKAAARAAAVPVVKLPGHGHTCPVCMKDHRHEDPKCSKIGLAWYPCTVCSPNVDMAIFGVVAVVPMPLVSGLEVGLCPGDSFETIILDAGGDVAESQG